jgi:hypothetical protein
VIGQGEAECWLASVDLVTGMTTQIGDASFDKCAFDLEFTPDGKRLIGTHVGKGDTGNIATVVEFDLTTGDVTTLSQLGDFNVGGPGGQQGNITFGPDTELSTYLVPQIVQTAVDPACDGSAFCLFHVDHEDPTQVTYVNTVPQFETTYFGLATSCAGVTSSVRDAEPDAASASWPAAGQQVVDAQTLTRVNLTSTGPATTDVGPVGDGVSLTSLDYDTAGTLYAVGWQPEHIGPSLFTVDPATGAATPVATLNDGEAPIDIGVEGFAIAHPCSSPTPPTPPAPPAAEPVAAVAPRFTG